MLRSTCVGLRDREQFDLRLILGGMHCSADHGETAGYVRADGFTPCAELAWIPTDAPGDPHREAAQALRGVGEVLTAESPDALLLVGDRYETAAAALAATLSRVPLVHLHGGEETEGAIDNACRHAISKLSHLHLVSHESHREALLLMGEDPASVHVVGAPGLDNLRRTDLPSRQELEAALGLALVAPVVIVTLHPATLGEDPAKEATAVVGAMDRVEGTYVITLPNADPGSKVTRDVLTRAAAGPRRVATSALGERLYWGLMRHAAAMLGNSSSALIEAPLLGVPAVNVGERQRGRLRGDNAVDAPPDADAIAKALHRSLRVSAEGRARSFSSPYGDGRSAERILGILAGWTPPRPPVKRGVARRAP